MDEKLKNLLLGCGAFLFVGFLVLLYLAFHGYLFFKDVAQDFERAEELRAELRQLEGTFLPSTDGSLSMVQLGTFLAVRKQSGDLGRSSSERLRELDESVRRANAGEASPWSVFRIIGSGIGAIPELAELYGRRCETLLQNEMSLEEYLYIYTLGFYRFLEKSPADGPSIVLVDQDEIQLDTDTEDEDPEKIRSHFIRTECSDLFRSVFGRALEDSSYLSRVEPAWEKVLQRELRRLEVDHLRLPFEDEPLPKPLLSSLEPFQVQLEESYDPILNALEWVGSDLGR